MKTLINIAKCILLVAVFSLSFYQCNSEAISENEAPLQENYAKAMVYVSELSGDNEVPMVNTDAFGRVIVRISNDESSIHYKLIVNNIENVTMSHFHMAPAGVNSGIVVWLYDNRSGQPSGPSNGLIAEGVIMAEDIVGALEGNMSGLIDAIKTGNIYVNVHTGQFGGGEIRGQL